jgi:hypothetical protein
MVTNSVGLSDTLDRGKIPYLSSETVVDPRDSANCLLDTHFTDDDERLALAPNQLLNNMVTP